MLDVAVLLVHHVEVRLQDDNRCRLQSGAARLSYHQIAGLVLRVAQPSLQRALDHIVCNGPFILGASGDLQDLIEM